MSQPLTTGILETIKELPAEYAANVSTSYIHKDGDDYYRVLVYDNPIYWRLIASYAPSVSYEKIVDTYIPDNVDSIDVVAIAGGGSGGWADQTDYFKCFQNNILSTRNARITSSGGSAGEVVLRTNVDVSINVLPNRVLTLQIGAGGGGESPPGYTSSGQNPLPEDLVDFSDLRLFGTPGGNTIIGVDNVNFNIVANGGYPGASVRAYSTGPTVSDYYGEVLANSVFPGGGYPGNKFFNCGWVEDSVTLIAKNYDTEVLGVSGNVDRFGGNVSTYDYDVFSFMSLGGGGAGVGGDGNASTAYGNVGLGGSGVSLEPWFGTSLNWLTNVGFGGDGGPPELQPYTIQHATHRTGGGGSGGPIFMSLGDGASRAGNGGSGAILIRYKISP